VTKAVDYIDRGQFEFLTAANVERRDRKATVINLFAGPGVGKSTSASGLFYRLKQRGECVEIAHEYAKDLTWEGRDRAIAFQPYVAARQIWRVERLLDAVDWIVTDSPVLLSLVYRGEGSTQAFEEYVLDTFRSWRTLNIRLERNALAPYHAEGRGQSYTEATRIDKLIESALMNLQIPHHVVPVLTDADTTVDRMLEIVDAYRRDRAQGVIDAARYNLAHESDDDC
jgi:hypothetical protein